MVIYADEVFLINLIINYLVLLASSKLCAVPLKRYKLAFGAALGGIYAVSALVVPFLRHPVVKLSVGILMTMAAFGGHRRLLRIILTVLGVSAAFAGVIYAITLMSGIDAYNRYIPMSFKTLILAFGVCYLVISVVFKRLSRTSSEIVNMTVEYMDKRADISVLRDTGHSLIDPMTGDPVIICDAESLATLFDKRDIEFLSLPPAEAVEKLNRSGHRFRLITYSALGVESGLLAAFRPDGVKINRKTEKGCIIAISPNPVSDGGAYSALIGADYD